VNKGRDTVQFRQHAALTATLGLAAAAWVVAVRQMNGTDMGGATPLGSFALTASAASPIAIASPLALTIEPTEGPTGTGLPAGWRRVGLAGRLVSAPDQY
jgi:hypothetical protein